MLRIVLIAFTVFLLATPVAAGSPRENASFIAMQQVDEHVQRAVWGARVTQLVKKIRKPLAELGGEITDPEGFAAMIPDNVMEATISGYREAVADIYLQGFSEQELSDIAGFLRTEAARKVRAAAPEPPPPTPGIDVHFGWPPPILPDPYTMLTADLSAEEVDLCLTFLNSETGKGLREKTEKAWRLYDTGAHAALRPKDRERDLTAPYLIEIFEVDGFVTFANRITRREVVAALRAQGG